MVPYHYILRSSKSLKMLDQMINLIQLFIFYLLIKQVGDVFCEWYYHLCNITSKTHIVTLLIFNVWCMDVIFPL